MQEVAIKELKEKIEAIRSDAEEKIASLKFAISILEGDNTPKSKPMTFSIKGQKGSDELYNFGRLSVEERGERILSITRGTGSFLHVNVIAKEIVGYDADEKSIDDCKALIRPPLNELLQNNKLVKYNPRGNSRKTFTYGLPEWIDNDGEPIDGIEYKLD
ncbi:hypothetical protein [Roseivirga sp. UBA838]|uniref:hypothetical protein n=1 Tax=Roseivirga sp. UBA838 TaxID=1947393 RepID=UPI002579D80B|nr:hypothetical protein [Roseivirga sp. UBA838]|tara:strand:- start:4525 stop:5004 length:480 start_codon:yes stop_codon:yes gene_type:complete